MEIQPAPSTRTRAIDNPMFPRIRGPVMTDLLPEKPQPPLPDGVSAAYALARRIEALARVLADPQPAIRRLAKLLAGLPPYALPDPPSARDIDSRWWWHGRPEWFNVNALARPAVRALVAACTPPPEPG